jgi:hypothetical protein
MTTADIGSPPRRLRHDRTELRPHGDENAATAEQVAGVVAGIPAIGKACEALVKGGWRASIAANRITVNDEVIAQFIGAGVGRADGVEATWVIYGIAGTPPVWVVGAERQP